MSSSDGTMDLEDEQACLLTRQLYSSMAMLVTLATAIELGVLEIIAKAGPNTKLTPAQIASKIPTKNPQAADALDRMLKLLASYSVLCCSVDTDPIGGVQRKYGATPLLKFITRKEEGSSLSTPFLLIKENVLMQGWFHLTDAVLNGGIAFERAHGMPMYEYCNKDPKFNSFFNSFMASDSIVSKNLLQKYTGFNDVNVLVNVGGGTGAILGMIRASFPHIKCINFDLSHVISEALTIPGVEHIQGDMFTDIPRGDAILLKYVLHNWNDEECLKILQNCWKALPEKGEIIVLEYLLPVAPEPTPEAKITFQLDMVMLMMFDGRERTENEYRSLAKAAGFSGFEVLFNFCCASLFKLMK